jgi:hypothetical protein
MKGIPEAKEEHSIRAREKEEHNIKVMEKERANLSTKQYTNMLEQTPGAPCAWRTSTATIWYTAFIATISSI